MCFAAFSPILIWPNNVSVHLHIMREGCRPTHAAGQGRGRNNLGRLSKSRGATCSSGRETIRIPFLGHIRYDLTGSSLDTYSVYRD